jgi:uncharacterized protein
MRWTHLPAWEYRRERWKNDLGWTREILRRPAGGDDFDWRVSIGEIERDAPFSPFPGCARELVLLSGGGLELAVDGQVSALEPPHGRLRFGGDAAVQAHLRAGPVHVFNLIWRADRHAAQLLHRPLVGPMLFFDEPGVDWLLHLMSGRAELRDQARAPMLEAGDSLWLQGEGSDPRRLILAGGGELLAVRIDPLPEP